MTRALFQERAGNPKEPYGPASTAHYADPGYQPDGRKRYPLDSASHCRAAWSYINMPKNAAKYTPQQLARIKSRIKAAGRRYGVDFADSRSMSFPEYLVEGRRAFIESNYERDPKGTTTGGQFTSKPKTAEREPDKPKPKPKARDRAGSRPKAREEIGSKTGDMSYDPKTGRGTGYGSAGGDSRVKRLQRALNRLGVRDSRGRRLDVDGKLGPLTTQAIKAAQRRLGIKADGVVSAALLDRIDDAKSLPAKAKPKRCVCRSAECLSDECRDDDGLEVRAAEADGIPREGVYYANRWWNPDYQAAAEARSAIGELEPRSTLSPAPASGPDLVPGGGDGRVLEGYVAVFNQSARISDRNGDFDEEIHRGAFDRWLEKRGFPVMQFEHGKDSRVGMLPIGVYEVFEPDRRGYYVRGRLLDDPVVEPIRKAIKDRAIRGMSWRMLVPDSGQRWIRRSRYEVDKRDITDADIPEAGPVVFPAHTGTSVSVRSLLERWSDDELSALAAELRAHLGLATDLTVEPSARSVADGDHGTRPGGQLPKSPNLLARDRAMRMRGVLT